MLCIVSVSSQSHGAALNNSLCKIYQNAACMAACTAKLRCPLPTLRCPLLTVPTHARIIHDDVIKWNHFLRHWPSVWGIQRSPVNSPHKGHRRGASKFSLIWAWINGRVNNGEAGDLGRHRSHYDVIVMYIFVHIIRRSIAIGSCCWWSSVNIWL